MRVSVIRDEGPQAGALPRAATPGEERVMREAVRLARRGIGTTHPNPRVGAVVLREGQIVGAGFHLRPGEAHAEVSALARAGERARGAVLVTTLEPCAHHGRTPPCVDAIAAAGVGRVVVGMRDPNPVVDGRGIQALRDAGIEVAEGVCEAECRALNPAYLKFLSTGLPWILLKSMISLDGRMASETGDSRGLGGTAEQRLCHRLRAEHDAILVGIGTVLADDPELTVRMAPGRSPLRVVLDSRLRLEAKSRLVRTAKAAPLLVATVSPDRAAEARLSSLGARVWRFEPDADGRVPLGKLLRRLASDGALSVLAEGGPTVHTALLRGRFADRVAVGVAPLLLGGTTAPTWTRDLGRSSLAEAIELGPLTTRKVGRDLWIEADLGSAGGSDV